MLSQLILAMAKRALPHRAVASSLGLALHVLRRYFAPELICGAPLCQINRRRHPPPAHRRPAARRAAPEKPPVEDELPLNEDVLPSIVYNNDGEPNADYQVFVERRHARPFFRASRSAKTPFLRLVS